MNALTNITADPLVQAVARANDWLRVARPVIKAYFALEDIEGDLGSAGLGFRGDKRWNEAKAWDERTMDEARDLLRKPVSEMQELIEAIRQTAIDDEMPRWTQGCDVDAVDAEYERYEQAMADVLSVKAAIKIVADEPRGGVA
ncbi:hypothetical protein [Sphingomonas sp.]|uniref:hypothetical protein n=1 Tax=Sphingomonas sp. TaxID=28214 RepID=UPI003B3A1257